MKQEEIMKNIQKVFEYDWEIMQDKEIQKISNKLLYWLWVDDIKLKKLLNK